MGDSAVPSGLKDPNDEKNGRDAPKYSASHQDGKYEQVKLILLNFAHAFKAISVGNVDCEYRKDKQDPNVLGK